ncbi:MAG: hypothetical protein K2J80_10675 [Oscillospiraceae bacterium]|nr:hypothetical protein [Oscillospiraceae bacterium]
MGNNGGKFGMGLLLFGIILSNGSSFDCGDIFFLVGVFLGFIGLVCIVCTRPHKNNVDVKNEIDAHDVKREEQ